MYTIKMSIKNPLRNTYDNIVAVVAERTLLASLSFHQVVAADAELAQGYFLASYKIVR